MIHVPNFLSLVLKKCQTSLAAFEWLLSCVEDAHAESWVFDPLLDGVPGGGDGDEGGVDNDDDSSSEPDGSRASRKGGGGRTATHSTATTFLWEDGNHVGGACITVSEQVFFQMGGGTPVEVDASGWMSSPLMDFCLALPLFCDPVMVISLEFIWKLQFRLLNMWIMNTQGYSHCQ